MLRQKTHNPELWVHALAGTKKLDGCCVGCFTSHKPSATLEWKKNKNNLFSCRNYQNQFLFPKLCSKFWNVSSGIPGFILKKHFNKKFQQKSSMFFSVLMNWSFNCKLFLLLIDLKVAYFIIAFLKWL